MRSAALTLITLCASHSLCAQAMLNLSQDLVRWGIASTNMVPNQPKLDAGPLLLNAVQYAKGHQTTLLTADPGAYYFLSTLNGAHLSLGGISTNLTIDLQGSDLYFSNPLVIGFAVFNSSNVTIQNFTMDYTQLLYTQLLVTSVNGGNQVQFTVQPSWQPPTALNAFLNNSGPTETDLFVFRNGRPWPGYTRLPVQNPFTNDKLTVMPTRPVNVQQIRPGDVAVLAVRGGASLLQTANCNSCIFRNIKIYSGIVGFILDGQSSLAERVYVMPRPGTDRLVSTIADGLWLTQGGPNNTFRLGRAIRTLDDGISLHVEVYATVQAATGPRTLQLRGDVATALNQNRPILNGSTVQFQRPSDGAILGDATVVSQSPGARVNGLPQLSVNFDRDLPANLGGAYIYPTDHNQRDGNTLLERNCVQEQGYARGMNIMGLVDSSIKGNYIHRSAMTGMHIRQDLNLAAEPGPPNLNLTISANVVDAANTVLDTDGSHYEEAGIEVQNELSSFAISPYSQNQNLNITENFIADPARAGVILGNTAGGTVSNNYLLHPNNNPTTIFAGPSVILQAVSEPLVITSSQNITVNNNTVDVASGRMWVTDSSYRELAAYSPGSIARLNAYNLGRLTSPAITLTDADGKVSNIAITATAAHALDIQIPTGLGLGGAYVTLTAGNTKYFATLFLDSADNIPVLNGCTYETSLASRSVAANASSLPILVVTQSGCTYQVLAVDSFVQPGAAATGTQVISVGFAANGGTGRNATIEIAGQPITVTQAAPLPTVQAIADVWDYSPGVAPGAWVAIAGTALAGGTPQTWNLSGVQQLPTTLASVTVTFDGTPAALSYVSSTQINALVPASVKPGPVQVVVHANGTSSVPFLITATSTLPSVYALPTQDASAFFITAALQGTAVLVGNAAVDSRVVRAAQPGDILDLYMVGLGATDDPSKFVTDKVFAGAYALSAGATASIGGKPAPVLFAGLTSPGLYLVRIAIPADLAAGAQPIQVAVAGSQTRPSLLLLVGTP
jgi:uncharacterized protein (TIGR03437 family)